MQVQCRLAGQSPTAIAFAEYRAVAAMLEVSDLRFQASHQRRTRNRVEVAFQVRVHYVDVPLLQQFVDSP